MFKVVDLQDKETPLVVKVCEDHRLFAKEISAMHNIERRAESIRQPGCTSKTPKVVAYGMVMVCDEAELADTDKTLDEEEMSDKVMMSYLIMPRFGRNLETYFESQKRALHKSSIYHLGMACLDLLEQIHAAGYIYNDLKLDNLLVDYKQHLPAKSAANKNAFANASINLVDFGFATKYVERARSRKKDGNADETVHISKTEVDVFRGNMIFSSTNQLQFYSTSRRDDLIALCYLLIYLVR